MKLTCPACTAKYTISDERLDGRRVKVRCKRCGESFPAEPSKASGEVYAQTTESRRGRNADLFAGVASAGAEEPAPSAASNTTQLTGERNESSVLFSLATLAKTMTPAPTKTTESSALIDIRALVSATANGESSSARADDIVNLSGGGAFAPLFAPPVILVQAQESGGARGHTRTFMLGAFVLAVVSMLGIATVASARMRSSGQAVPILPQSSVLGIPTAPPAAVPTAVTTDEPPSSAPVVAIIPGRTIAPPVTSVASHSTSRPIDAHPVASQSPPVSTASTSTSNAKCCPGENETACHMRLSVGAACGGEQSTTSSSTTAPPFDRPAAARALGVNVASCKRADGPTGSGHVKVTFQPSGYVSAVDVEGPYSGTAVGACVAQRYRSATVPAFSGGSLSVGKSFSIE